MKKTIQKALIIKKGNLGLNFNKKNMLDNFLVYENWRTEIGGKAVVHKSNCGTAKIW